MTTVWTWVFAVSSCSVLYTYVVYPILLALGHAVHRWRFTPPEDQPKVRGPLPQVSVVISAHNEQAVIESKLKNLQSTDYPPDRIEFLIGSDGSTDRTNEILLAAQGGAVKPVLYDRNRGKAAVLNDLIAGARGEFLVFSDANTVYSPATIRALVEGFDDPRIGGVCGELVLEADARTMGGQGESWYWRYETAIKRWESECGTLIGATGGVYAIRRALYEPLETSTPLTDDLLIALRVVRQGFRVVYAPAAVASEKTPDSVSSEFRRKTRIGAQNFNTLTRIAGLLHPRHGFAAFAFFSHKIVRWAVPFLLLGITASSVALAAQSPVYAAVAAGSGAVALLAAAGWILERARVNLGVLGLPYYFVAMNAALLIGFLRFAFGTQAVTWTVERDHGRA